MMGALRGGPRFFGVDPNARARRNDNIASLVRLLVLAVVVFYVFSWALAWVSAVAVWVHGRERMATWLSQLDRFVLPALHAKARALVAEREASTRSARRCVMCRSSPPAVVATPCRHFALCAPCWDRFRASEGDICSVCREPATQAPLALTPPPPIDFPTFPTPPTPAPTMLSPALVWFIVRQWHCLRWARVVERKHKCVECRERERRVLATPCNHLVLCAACVRGAFVCPLCRSNAQPKEVVTTHTCAVCFDDVDVSDMSAVDPCAHMLCTPCAVQYVRTALGSVADSVFARGLKCPMHHSGCTSMLTLPTIALLVRPSPQADAAAAAPSPSPSPSPAPSPSPSPAPSPSPSDVGLSQSELDRLAIFVDEAAIPPANRFACVYADCGRMLDVCFADVLALDDALVCCPRCSRRMCVRCKVPVDHRVRHACTKKERGVKSDTMSLIQATTKGCPKCGMRISHYHGHGCHHIRPGTGCPNCSHHFCYCCLAPFIPRQCHCQLFCPESDVVRHVKQRPYPYDTRCGCPICPECARGRPCAQCTGSCVVCRGVVPPGRQPDPDHSLWGRIRSWWTG